MNINKILCVGAALNDLLLQESDDFLSQLGNEKGGMTLVEKEKIDEVNDKTQKSCDSAPGGSACNTAVGIARLGGQAAFLGKRGQDGPGSFIEDQLKQWGVVCNLKQSNTSTGQVLSIITPDAQRTMLTYLGAASESQAEELSIDDFEGHDLVHVEGYLLFNTPYIQKVFDLAKSAGCKISMDLSSFEVVQIFREQLPELIEKYVDVLIANEDEAKAYTDADPKASLETFAKLSELAIVKLGAEGVLIARGEERINVPGTPVNAIDTTGAGDLWASGFFYGLSQGWSLEEAAKMGHQTGSSVVQVIGAVIPDDVYEKIKN